MKDTSLQARVTKAGEAIGERVQTATAATAAAAGQAQMVADATAATAVAAGRAKKALDDAGEAAQQAWSQAAAVAEDLVDSGRRATSSVSRQIGGPIDRGSGRLRTRLRCGLVDTRTPVD